MTESLMTINDVSQKLGISARMVNKLVREHKLECYELTPKNRRFATDHVERFLQSRHRKVPKQVDRETYNPVPFRSQKGGAKSTGVDREALRKEMREW